ncbi:hypothetical protein GCM10020331_034100 [Ectobacillus funiculus]
MLEVKVDVKDLLGGTQNSSLNTPKGKEKLITVPSNSILITDALDVITRQMRVSGCRSRTISDYVLHVEHFSECYKSALCC